LKLVFVLIIPIATLMFLNPREIERPRVRKISIAVAIGVQFVVICVIVWVAIVVRRPSADAWADLVIAGVGVVGEIVGIVVKTKPRKAEPIGEVPKPSATEAPNPRGAVPGDLAEDVAASRPEGGGTQKPT
jgi:amino acid transporter